MTSCCARFCDHGAADFQQSKLDALGLCARLDATAISAQVAAAKPDPRMFGHALQLLGLQPGALEAGGTATAVEPKCVRPTP